MTLNNSLWTNFEKEFDINITNQYKTLNLWNSEINQSMANFLEKFKRFPIISITWPAWVWKTTITETVASFLSAKIYRELHELNPFLALISTTKWKMKDTLWYPNQSLFCSQDSAIITDWFMNASNNPIVFDFAITQTKAFWNIKLKWKEKQNFNDLFEWIFYWTKNWFWWLASPDLVIEVRADSKTILERRKSRGKYIDWSYEDEVDTMNNLYHSWFVWSHFENVIVFDNDANISKEELINKVNDFLIKLSI